MREGSLYVLYPDCVVLCANDPAGAWGAVRFLEQIDISTQIVSGPVTDNEDQALNEVVDESMLRFVPELKKRLSLSTV